MALVVEDGSGKSNADAYVDVAFADTYVTDFLGGDSDWSAASTTEKEVAIRRATQFLDGAYVHRWSGLRRFGNQALAWPRYSVITSDFILLDSDVIPIEVKRATVEAAVRSFTVDLTPDTTPSDRSVKSRESEFAVFRESVEYAGAQSTQPDFRKIERLLAPLLQGAGNPPVNRG